MTLYSDDLPRSFVIAKKVDTTHMGKLVADMQRLLEAFACGELPNERYTRKHLQDYCRSLIENQRGELTWASDSSRVKEGSFCVAPDAEGMGSDARVDFIMFPTYIAVALLTRFLLTYPEEAGAIPSFKEGLRLGMVFSSYQELRGHGYDSEREMFDALDILKLGRVPEYLSRYPDACPELAEVLRQVADQARDAIKTGKTKGGWNEDYSKEYHRALDILRDFLR